MDSGAGFSLQYGRAHGVSINRQLTPVSAMWNLNLIRFLDFYLVFMFVMSIYRRLRQYHDVGKLVLAGPGRWPRLLELVKQHYGVFLTWRTAMPALLAGLLSVVQVLASRLFWPQAQLITGQLIDVWPALLAIAGIGLAMFSVDLYGLVGVGILDRAEMEKYFDQAEYWLRSKTAHVVRVFTFGRVNPRRMVADEVRKALLDVAQMLNTSLWWMTVQLGLRIAFGLSIWLTWALAFL
jgi:hypothetical protein